MAEQKPKSSGQTVRTRGRNRRRPPTIELKATEVAAGDPAAASNPPTSPSEPPITPEAEAVTPAAAQSAAAAAAETGEAEAQQTVEPEVNANANTDVHQDSKTFTQASTDEGQPPSPPPPQSGWKAVGAGAVGGGVVAIAALLVAWAAIGTPSVATLRQQSVRLNSLDDTVDSLQTSLHSLDASVHSLEASVKQSSAAAADAKTVAALSRRVGALEHAVEEASAKSSQAPAASPAVADKLSGLEKTVDQLKAELASLEQRSSQAAAVASAAQKQANTAQQSAATAQQSANSAKARADTAAAAAQTAQSTHDQGTAALRGNIDALDTRVAALQRITQSLQHGLAAQEARIEKAFATRTADHAVRRAVAAESLKIAVARGGRFRAELEAAKSLAEHPVKLAPLDIFADRGVPSATELGRELIDKLPDMRQIAEPSPNSNQGFFEQLQVNAERLVRIHPIGETSGNDTDSILSRVEARAQHGNIGGALAELDKLPTAVRAPAEPWIRKVKERDAALDAAEQFAASAIGALTPSSK